MVYPISSSDLFFGDLSCLKPVGRLETSLKQLLIDLAEAEVDQKKGWHSRPGHMQTIPMKPV